jgi:hypothetical protein
MLERCGLVIVSIIPLFVRRPLFLFALAFCLAAGTGASRALAMRRWS